MQIVVQYIKSLIFIFLMYFWMLILGLIGALPAAFSTKSAAWFVKCYANHVLWLAYFFCGIRYEVRGKIPSGDVVIASKHQSFLDVILHTALLPRVNFIMKRELKWAPVLGFYALRIGSAPVKRGNKSKAVQEMMQGVTRNQNTAAQLVIYPQGTRVSPGKRMPYKVGAAVICERMGKPCIPAATNAGVIWPKHSILRRPGIAVIEYLEPMPGGLGLEAFTKALETQIEPASNALMEEAGFVFKDQ